jgi:hypothetical protein
MVAQVAAADFILTTIGRVAVRPLAGYLAKNGGKKFAQQYGPKAFEAILGTTVGLKAYKETEEYLSEYLNHIDEGGEEGSFVPKGSMPDTDRMKQMDSMMAVPNVNPNINRSIRGTPAGLVIGGEPKEVMPPPEPFSTPVDSQTGTILSTPIPEKVDTTLSTPIPEKVDTTLSTPIEDPEGPQIYLEDNKDISEQTKDLVPEKAELGPLTAVEKQTALALKGNKPDFYSRAVEAITNAKQDKSTKGKWKSIVQSNSTKEEIKYLGLDKYLQGNESITKQELLDFVDQKNIADKLSVVEVPLEDQLDFSQYSIGGAGGKRARASESTREVLGAGNVELPTMEGYRSTVEQYVFKVDGPKKWSADFAHFIEKYANNAIAHARAQTGYFNADAVEKRLDLKEADGEKLTNNDKVLKNASRQLADTFIIDEIQSDAIQDIQKYGAKDDFVIIKGKDITQDFLQKNYPSYAVKSTPLDILEGKSNEELKNESLITLRDNTNVLYSVDSTTGISAPEVRLMDNNFYVFNKNSLVTKGSYKTKEQAEKQKDLRGYEALPITESKKYVELVLNAMIKKAVEKNLDSIGITNGQIQYDRYTGQPIKDKEGLKKFYDEIVYKQLEKVADKYNVKLETVKLPGKAGPKEFDDVGLSEPTESGDGAAITRRASRAIRNGFVLRKISGNLLASTLDDLIQGRFEDPERANHPGAVLPDYTSILTDTGAASGNMVLENLIEDSADTDGDKDYYIWVAPNTPIDNAIQAGTDRYSSLSGIWDIRDINLQMPISPAIQTEGADFVQIIREDEGRDLTDYFEMVGEGTGNSSIDVNNYNNYINNFYNKENFDIGYSHEIIKMPLPKKLQKDILSKPIKLSKLKTQTDRLTS